MLPIQAAARLRVVCGALRAMVLGWPMHLSDLRGVDPKAALTCFPATERLTMSLSRPLDRAEESRMVSLLRKHGGTLKRVTARVGGMASEHLLLSAVRAGALPNLTYFQFNLHDPIHREILSGGMLRLLEEVYVLVEEEEDLAALGHLQNLSHLSCLRLSCEGGALEATLPPFIPPSLRRLKFDFLFAAFPEAWLCELPPMLEASGASLESLELLAIEELTADGGDALAQVLRACATTLKTFSLDASEAQPGSRYLVPGLTSCCDTLEVLDCPWAIFSALRATCPSFPRLTKLTLGGGADEDIDLASPAWDIMANGRLPALATIKIIVHHGFILGARVEGDEATEGTRRLSRACEAVAGTLTRLTLSNIEGCEWPAGACYGLGAAIGKLRRLKYLYLQLFPDGRGYQALGRGMAASGGCPDLFEVRVDGPETNLDLLTFEPSLIVPSVRRLTILDNWGTEQDKVLMLCCGLVQMGYKYHLWLDMHDMITMPCLLHLRLACGPFCPVMG
jgi:hypothetical protein